MISVGAVRTMYDNPTNTDLKPVLQVINIKKIQAQSGSTASSDRYRPAAAAAGHAGDNTSTPSALRRPKHLPTGPLPLLQADSFGLQSLSASHAHDAPERRT